MSLVLDRSYSDPEQLEKAFGTTNVELLPTKNEPFEAHVVRLELDRLRLLRVAETSPRIKWATQSSQRTFIRFLTGPQSQIVIDGVSLQANEIVHFGSGHSYFEHSCGPVQWASISLPLDDPAARRIAIAGRDIAIPRSPSHAIPSATAMTRLRRLHADACSLAQANPTGVDIPVVANGLERSLLEALAECLDDHTIQTASLANGCHDTIMRRFRRALEAEPNRALYVPELCNMIKVPERTLRHCCQERLGVSPKHYLMLRRMHLARRALGAADPEATTVTEVATRFGFWHFGRFAGGYRMIFGESPSATLHRVRRYSAVGKQGDGSMTQHRIVA